MAVAVPFVQAFLWRVPLGYLPQSVVLRGMFGAILSTVLIGLVTAGICFLLDRGTALSIALTAGCLGAALLIISVRRSARERGAAILAYRLLHLSTKQGAKLSLLRLLRSAEPKPNADPSPYARLVLRILAPLTHAECWTEAEALLAALPSEKLDPQTAALGAQGLATCRVQLGNLEGAHAALNSVPRPVPDAGIEEWLRTTDALLHAVAERPDEALVLLGDREETDPLRKASKRIVRAHALCTKGKKEDAKRELVSLREEFGPAALDRAILPHGPASELARAIAK